MKSKYYSPRLQRELISPLYHAAKAARIPMTTLASQWIQEGLLRLQRSQQKSARRAEE